MIMFHLEIIPDATNEFLPRDNKYLVNVVMFHSVIIPDTINEFNNDNNNRIQRRNSRFFFTISSQRRELSPTRTLKWPGRNRVQISPDIIKIW